MSPILAGIITFLILFFFLAFGMSLGLAMLLVGSVGLFFYLPANAAVSKIALSAYETVCNYNFSVLPLFLLMAYVTFHSGLVRDLFNLAAKWIGHIRGGMAIATLIACSGFASISSSAIATAAAIGVVAVPEMRRYGYKPSLYTAVASTGGVLGILIPPSATLVIYGIITEQSIGKLFIAGIIPGLLLTIFYILTVYILCKIRPDLGPPGEKSSFKEKIYAFSSCGEIISLILLVFLGIWIGWFTPTEAGAVGAFGSIIFSLIRRRLTISRFIEALKETMKTTGFIYFIVVGAMVFNTLISLTRFPDQLVNFVADLSMPPFYIMLVLVILYFLIGTAMDESAMMFLTIPIFFPIVMAVGYDPLWFGVIVVLAVETAMVSPPVGITMFITQGIAKDVPIQVIWKGVLPFWGTTMIFTFVILFFPEIVTFLPNLMQ